MPVLQNLMKRWGFVKLSRFGLILTPEGRVLSMRPAVLDDGMGGRIVGWQDGDLAAAELQRWEPARPAARTVAPRVAMPPPVPPPPPRMPEVTRPLQVAPAPVVEEDDWEWTIALARARAAAEEAVEAAEALAPPPAPIPVTPRLPLPLPPTTDEWPATAPVGAIDYEDYRSPVHDVVRIPEPETRKVAIVPPRPAPQPAPRAYARPGTPATVIPVPKLPSVTKTAREPMLRPVVRPVATTVGPAVAPRRIASGTSPVVGETTQVTQTMVPANDDTQTSVTTIGDRTKPGIAIPRVALPLTRRSAATRG